MKVAVNEPVPSVVMDDGLVLTAVPANVTVICELGMKFEPEIVTVIPWLPLVGLIVIDGVVTVNVCEAALPFASVTSTVFPPLLDIGTVNVTAENEPVLLVWTVAGFVATAVPANVTVITESAAKPVPESVTVLPMSPLVGLMVKDGVTVNVLSAVLVPSSAANV